jgi:hypothetical protein
VQVGEGPIETRVEERLSSFYTTISTFMLKTSSKSTLSRLDSEGNRVVLEKCELQQSGNSFVTTLCSLRKARAPIATSSPHRLDFKL